MKKIIYIASVLTAFLWMGCASDMAKDMQGKESETTKTTKDDNPTIVDIATTKVASEVGKVVDKKIDDVMSKYLDNNESKK